jgi:nitrous oxidase accessory protein NosD
LTNNHYGIVFVGGLGPCTYDKITANTIAENENGIYICGDWLERGAVIHTLTFHHNNIINNSVQLTSGSYGGIWDNGSEGNYWSNYNGTDANGDGVGDSPYVVIEAYTYNHTHGGTSTYGSTDVDHYPLIYPWGPPPILMIYPENETYPTSNVPLRFTVGKPNSWIGYSLDGSDNVTITGNTTLSGLSSGLHNLTLYASDMYGNIGASETIYFRTTDPFPTALVVAASGVSVAVVGVGLLVYFRKRKR